MSNSCRQPTRREGILYVISAPSGAGKTTLCRELLDIFPDLRHSISFTTRDIRPGEVAGRDYHFVSRDEFTRMVANREFAEWAEVHGNLYGTALQTLRRAREEGVDLLLDIDCQGAARLREERIAGVNIFILPPNFRELRRRLEGRESDHPDIIERRLANAVAEITQAGWYDYIVVNDQFSKALEEMKSIIIAERQRTARMIVSISSEFEINYTAC